MIVTITPSDVARDPFILDKVLESTRSPGDVIQLEAGVRAATRGNWAFEKFGWISLASGVTLRGGEVYLQDPVLETHGKIRPSKDLNILWAGEETSIQGTKFDCTAPAGWNGGGLRFHGKFTVTDCEIIGLSGTIGQQESFAISSVGDTGGSLVERVTVHKCFTESPTSYVSGIYLGATAGERGGVVRECTVDLGPNGWFAYSSTKDTVFDQCKGVAARFWYTDTGDGEAILNACSGRVSYAAVSQVAVEGAPSRKVDAQDCIFEAVGEARAAEWWSKPAEARGHFSFRRCTFLGFDYSAAVVSNRGALVFVDCDFQPSETDPKLAVSPGSPDPIFL